MESSQTEATGTAPNRRVRVIAGVAIVVALAAGAYFLLRPKTESTDNAQIDGHIYPVAPRVSGYLTTVAVVENQQVKKGDLLIQVDTADYAVRVQAARAALAAAKSELAAALRTVGTTQAQASGSNSAVEAARAQYEAARISRDKLKTDLQRAEQLLANDVISKAEYDAVAAQATAATAQADAAARQLASVQSQSRASGGFVDVAQVRVETARAQVQMREADLRNALLQLSYCTIRAQEGGIVSKKTAELGQLVNPGSPLLALVGSDSLWVTANFKETQLEEMKPGQTVDIEVDAYPGHRFEGVIESVSQATGARFALLPPDNATGNFVKTVQRVPVRIRLKNAKEAPLAIGMNATVKVHLN